MWINFSSLDLLRWVTEHALFYNCVLVLLVLTLENERKNVLNVLLAMFYVRRYDHRVSVSLSHHCLVQIVLSAVLFS